MAKFDLYMALFVSVAEYHDFCMPNLADIAPSEIPKTVSNDTAVAISVLLSFIFLVTTSITVCLISFGCWKRYNRYHWSVN